MTFLKDPLKRSVIWVHILPQTMEGIVADNDWHLQ